MSADMSWPHIDIFASLSPLTLHCSRCLLAFLTHNLYLPKYLLTLDHAGISFFYCNKDNRRVSTGVLQQLCTTGIQFVHDNE